MSIIQDLKNSIKKPREISNDDISEMVEVFKEENVEREAVLEETTEEKKKEE